TGSRRVEAGHEAEQRALAAATRTQYRHELSSLDGEVDVAQNRLFTAPGRKRPPHTLDRNWFRHPDPFLPCHEKPHPALDGVASARGEVPGGWRDPHLPASCCRS